MRRARPARTHGERQTKIRARRRSRSHLARHGVSRPCACVGFLMETVCATNSHRRGTNITGSDPIGEHDGDRTFPVVRGPRSIRFCFYRAPFRDRAPLIPHDSQHSEQNTTLPAAPWRFYVLSC